MAFIGLLPVRDEGDIIGQCLQHGLTWADAIYVFDTGSVDDTWEIVENLSRKDDRVKPVRKQAVYYTEHSVRGFLFDYARQFMREGDWFLRMDADEFHHVAPPDFVKGYLSKGETIAFHQYYNFCLLESEVARWNRGEEALADRSRPIEERRRHFIPSVYTEPRLCRYRSTMKWPDTTAFPYNAGLTARLRLPIRHYPHRDPVQLERRYRLRAAMMLDPEKPRGSDHPWAKQGWRERITADTEPGLLYWRPGEDLPDFAFRNHLRPPHVRLAQRLAHAFLLPILDRTRIGYCGETALRPISEEVQRDIELRLREKA